VGGHCPTKSASWCLSSIFKISEAPIEAPAAHKNASEGSLAVCSSIARATVPSLCSLELVIQLLYEHAFSLDSLFLVGSPQDFGAMVRRQKSWEDEDFLSRSYRGSYTKFPGLLLIEPSLTSNAGEYWFGSMARLLRVTSPLPLHSEGPIFVQHVSPALPKAPVLRVMPGQHVISGFPSKLTQLLFLTDLRVESRPAVEFAGCFRNSTSRCSSAAWRSVHGSRPVARSRRLRRQPLIGDAAGWRPRVRPS
jgi:hypothetical protein